MKGYVVALWAKVVNNHLFIIIVVVFLMCACACSHYSDDPSELPMNMLSRDDFLYPVPLDMEVKKDEVPISLWMCESAITT